MHPFDRAPSHLVEDCLAALETVEEHVKHRDGRTEIVADGRCIAPLGSSKAADCALISELRAALGVKIYEERKGEKPESNEKKPCN